MDFVKSEEEVYFNISVVKRNADQYITNFYFTGFKLKELIDKHKLYMIDNVNHIFFLRKNDGFYNLYFCSSNNSFLRESLAEDLKKFKLPIVIDLIGEEKTIKKLKDIFMENDFHYYTTFIRLSKMNSNINILYTADDILFAKQEDASEIYNMISGNFNKYYHHLPSLEEIRDNISKNNILIKKEKNKIIALSIFDKIGFSSTRRYGFVDKNFRGQKLYAKLSKKYFDECKEIKRFMCWVETSNSRIINIQKKYGYSYDNLTDLIMIKGLV